MYTIEDLLREFDYDNGVPVELCEYLLQNATAYKPVLRGIIRYTIDNYLVLRTDNKYIALQYALLLLAQMRDQQAFPFVMELVSLDAQDVDLLLNDMTGDIFAKVLYSTFDGDVDSLFELILNTSLNEDVRIAAMEMLPVLIPVFATREQVEELLAKVYDKAEANSGGYNEIWITLVCLLQVKSLKANIVALFDEGLVGKEIYDNKQEALQKFEKTQKCDEHDEAFQWIVEDWEYELRNCYCFPDEIEQLNEAFRIQKELTGRDPHEVVDDLFGKPFADLSEGFEDKDNVEGENDDLPF